MVFQRNKHECDGDLCWQRRRFRWVAAGPSKCRKAKGRAAARRRFQRNLQPSTRLRRMQSRAAEWESAAATAWAGSEIPRAEKPNTNVAPVKKSAPNRATKSQRKRRTIQRRTRKVNAAADLSRRSRTSSTKSGRHLVSAIRRIASRVLHWGLA